jgi:deoxyadenosine/deoxycytidine kinase
MLDKMKIGLCGTMSVGKTTLVKALSEMEQFKGYTCTTERSKYLNSLGIPLNHETTIEGQTIFLAERVTELMQDRLITDRTVLDVMAFTNCAKRVSYMDGDAFAEYASRFVKQYDYIFYISPDGMGMEDNGIRETDADYRKEIDEEIQKLLLKYRPVYFELKGTTEERIEQIMKTIQF